MNYVHELEALRQGHPGVNVVRDARDRKFSARLADAITRFAGSMRFVALHIAWFAAWIGFRVEAFPFGLLTMIVSLEAIFLATFVMISQNRADEKRESIAAIDHANLELNTALTKQIAEQTKKI